MSSNILCRVDVLFWQGCSSVTRDSDGLLNLRMYSSGHVALHIHHPSVERDYISFWPPSCPWQECPRGQYSHFHTADEDLLAERTAPETVPLFLNANKVRDAVKGFNDKIHLYTWGLGGSSILRRSYEKNCAGLVLDLLKKGGLEEIVPVENSFSRTRRLATTSAGLTIILFGGFFSLRSLLPPLRKITYNASLFKSAVYTFTYLVDVNFRGLENFRKMHTQWESIRNALQKQDRTLDKMGKKIRSISTQVLLLVQPYETLLAYHSWAKRQVMIATASALLPFVCIALALIFQQRLFSRTITPRDVAQLAKKAQQLQRTENIRQQYEEKSCQQ